MPTNLKSKSTSYYTLANNSPGYQQQLEAKVSLVVQALSKIQTNEQPKADVFPSPEHHYRMRAEFRVWHEGDDLYYAMFPKKRKGGRGEEKNRCKQTPYRVDQLDAAALVINQLMPKLLERFKAQTALRNRLFQIEFLSNKAGDCLVSLIYHRALDADWEEKARELETNFGIAVIGRSKKQCIILSSNALIEEFTVNSTPLYYQQIENSFTQPNAYINEKMLQWANDVIRSSNKNTKDLLELYCGNGNFTLALAGSFRKVLATEISKTSLKAARYNVQANNSNNIEVVRLSAEEVTTALSGGREFRRLKNIDLNSYEFETVFVDPPRAGLDAESLTFIQKFPSILYISCNPFSLAENLKTLTDTHSIARLAVFDQFPHTEHIECGVFLIKN